MTEPTRLAELSAAIRDSTMKRLRRVPPGAENWRPTADSLSFADIAHHLLHADEWLGRKLAEPSLGKMTAQAHESGPVDSAAFSRLLERLEASGRERATRISGMSAAGLDAMIFDDRFGGDVSTWWVIVRGNLDHETHHRGQLAALLRIFGDRTP